MFEFTPLRGQETKPQITESIIEETLVRLQTTV